MGKKGFIVILLLGTCLGFSQRVHSQSSAIESGLIYLYKTQNESGSWGKSGTSTNTEYFSSAEVLETLKAFGKDNTSSYQTGSRWVKGQDVDHTAYLIHKIEIKANEGEDITSELDMLLSYRRPDGGWGGHVNFTSTNFHTAFALRVLKTVKYSDQNVIESALNYLKKRQNTDGGWGLKQGDDSTVFMAAVVLRTLSQFKEVYDLRTSINKAVAYLLSKQNSDGSFSTIPH